MAKEILTCEDIEIEKNKYYRQKTSVPLRDVILRRYMYLRRFLLL